MPRQIRQGDVLLVEVEQIPRGGRLVARDAGRVVLAYGEATGHAHAIFEDDVSMIEVDEGIRYLDVPSEAVLRHEEHASHVLPAGTRWVVRRQREYVPEGPRSVED
ncbi:MAG TPA: hypothetical protein VI670_21700 [Thermoanaerobaculia bacterium]|jgi:hypothetical protein